MKIKLMIVDDSIVVRAMLKQVIDKRPHDYELVASAKDGRDALYHLSTKEIDVIIMDVEMPRMNGIEALTEIMRKDPKPVIMFSSLTGRDTKETVEALKIGAMDFIQKPLKHVEFIQMQEEFHQKIQIAYKAKNKIRVNNEKKKEDKKEVKKEKRIEKNSKIERLALIGCSTGGPKALYELLGQIGGELDGSILVVQHMPKGNYTRMLAEHLNNHFDLDIKEAKDGEIIKKQTVYIGKAGEHMLIRQEGEKLYIELKEEEEEEEIKNGHRPSVNELLYSACELKDVEITVAILTGMGADGADAAKTLYEKNKEVYFIGESEETAVVYGMPKQLKNKVPTTLELPINKIGKEIEKKINEIND